ncbi:hypothetical protein ABB37_00718 [Leptomonas pyrrhocoris]|uniref:Uncharacterized protein n=1 Tax=Leptomonas pyrrhocoris TaxID=157538 RepID=A0A0N1J5I5_LEPPY|nr:hypothetical protein ABB37_00718 [Leptomonas pyrrhocoris]KPA86594.1 hypothetical protein ABB37_00718 [Leptomonas pyrrhocoris]|eukprot:XP_015665033.1 hypothetical protein ABB37_00718 [Leptomonas pyrrhocoris]
MPMKLGDVVKVNFANKSENQPSTVIGVVEAVDAAQEFATVFVGNAQSWSVLASSVTPLSLPASFSRTARDTQRVRSTATRFLSTAAGQQLPLSPSSSPTRHHVALETAVAARSKNDDTAHHAPENLRTVPSSSFGKPDNYSFEPNAPYTNVLYEMNARLTGLCDWSSPPLTTFFLTVLYLWLAVEGSGLPFTRSGVPLLSVASVVQRCAIAVVRTLVAVVLCACVSMAPRHTPASAFWLLFPLMVVSFGGLTPVLWWHTLVVGCFPVRLTSHGSATATAAPTAASAPLILCVGKTVLDAGRCVLRGVSTMMIALGESLRAVSEELN